MQIKVEGVASDEAKTLATQQDALVKTGLGALKDYYAAPDGPAGDSQRNQADAVIKNTGIQARDVRARRRGLEEIAQEAQDYKDDFLDWMAAL